MSYKDYKTIKNEHLTNYPKEEAKRVLAPEEGQFVGQTRPYD